MRYEVRKTFIFKLENERVGDYFTYETFAIAHANKLNGAKELVTSPTK